MFIEPFLSRFIKMRVKQKNRREDRDMLINDIKSTLDELNLLKNNYQFISGDMTDYYIFQLNALQVKYSYLIKKLKKYDTA